MSSRLEPLSPEVRVLLDHERELTPLPQSVRTRVAMRARASLRTGGATRVAATGAWRRWALAASLICLISTGVSAAVLEIRSRVLAGKTEGTPSVVPPPATAPAAARRTRVAGPAAPQPVVPPIAAPAPAVPVPAEASSRAPTDDAARAELRLLRQARAAVTRADYTGALRVIGEHGRRFKNGRLTEEREALRVKSLAELGRNDEARRVAAAFQARFPRSVLMEAVNQMAASTP